MKNDLSSVDIKKYQSVLLFAFVILHSCNTVFT